MYVCVCVCFECLCMPWWWWPTKDHSNFLLSFSLPLVLLDLIFFFVSPRFFIPGVQHTRNIMRTLIHPHLNSLFSLQIWMCVKSFPTEATKKGWGSIDQLSGDTWYLSLFSSPLLLFIERPKLIFFLLLSVFTIQKSIWYGCKSRWHSPLPLA